MEARIPLLSLEEERHLFGPYDRHVKEAERRLGVRLSARGGTLRIHGPDDPVGRLADRIGGLLGRIREGHEPTPGEVEEYLFAVRSGPTARDGAPVAAGRAEGSAAREAGGTLLPRPRTPAQEAYLDAMFSSDLVLAEGPAGTGKTFLAVAAAVSALQRKRVQRLVLTRPAVEAGEHLGFLPGDFEAKINPYLRPLYDALHDFLGPAGLRRLKDLDVVEIAPLAFMRGRTLNHAFVILDEAQNATIAQLKMFLTRMGEGSVAVVTGDGSQTDLPEGTNGLEDATRRLSGLEGVALVRFTQEDIQRSPMVQRIVEAYGGDS